MTSNTQQLLWDLIVTETKNTTDVLMVRDDQSYHLYGIYQLIPDRDRTWKVYRRSIYMGTFETRQIAASWCMADKKNLVKLCQQVKNTNDEYRRVCDRIFWNSQPKKTLLHNDVKLAKRSQDQALKQALEIRLSKLISRAKYLQIQGFNHEIARTGHQSSRQKRR